MVHDLKDFAQARPGILKTDPLAEAKKAEQDHPSDASRSQHQDPKKRDQKSAMSKVGPLINRRGDSEHWHCCLECKGGKRCLATKFTAKMIWRHIRRKMHVKADYPRSEGLPWDVQPCTGPGCKFCSEPK